MKKPETITVQVNGVDLDMSLDSILDPEAFGGEDFPEDPTIKILLPQVPEFITLDFEIETIGKNPKHIYCPTCRAIVGQRGKRGEAPLVEWDHPGPCGAPCAGKRFQGARKRRKATDPFHTKHACPRCAPKPCPACRNKCECRACGGNGQFLEGDPEGKARPYSFWCPCTVKGALPGINCKHSCQRCGGKGKVHGLEAE